MPARSVAHDARPLHDHLKPGLDVVFVGINPGRASAAAGHHYAGPGNHFWPLLYEAGFVPEPLSYKDDRRCPEFGVGLTNIVARSTRGSDDLSREELRAGGEVLRQKLRRYRPRVVCFNGKLIYDAFGQTAARRGAGRTAKFGLQDERAEGALAFVMPSTSARTASYQRADKLRFFRELRGIVDKTKRDG